MALATEPRPFASADEIAALCGTQAGRRRSVRQQIRRWLTRMQAAGLRDWAYDSVSGAVFRTAHAAHPVPG
ncbi:hypothetical protein [Haliangium sp.]|uniref:hypothetical protein n=1 Tax=Haliangium sp. TaxID=2663208 RepID=UPI003D14CE04